MVLSLENLYFAYEDKSVLEDFSLSLPERGVACIFANSGCGKTTLLRLIAGLERPDSGEIRGIEPGEIAFMFQEDRLLPWLSVRGNIELGAAQDRSKSLALLERAGLLAEAGSYPDELSGGMKRRVALIRALLRKGSLLILDEPFKGLDSGTKRRLYGLVRAAAAEKLVIYISHDREEAEELSDFIYRVEGPPLRLLSLERRGRQN